jgi:hypothetical protein
MTVLAQNFGDRRKAQQHRIVCHKLLVQLLVCVVEYKKKLHKKIYISQLQTKKRGDT